MRRSEGDTKLLELNFNSEDTFSQALLNNKNMSEKIGGVLVEMKTADI